MCDSDGKGRNDPLILEMILTLQNVLGASPHSELPLISKETLYKGEKMNSELFHHRSLCFE